MFCLSPIIKCVDTACNLRCKYCSYRYIDQSIKAVRIMSEKVLERFIVEYLGIKQESHNFLWHGGEPLLAGLTFFEKAVRLQKKHNPEGIPVNNSIQTNGVLLTKEFVDFSKEHKFHIGLSLDGPEHIHNYYRKNNNGRGSFSRVMNGVKLCQEKGTPVSVIAVITDYSVQFPKEIYQFFLSEGIKSFALNPVFELDRVGRVCGFSVKDRDFSEFLAIILGLWLEDDDPEVFIRQFSEPLRAMLGGKTSTCIYSGQCSSFCDVFPNGDIKSCHNLLGESFSFGNFMEQPLKEIVAGENYGKFAKQVSRLSQECLRCRWLSICNGGCADQKKLMVDERFHEKYMYCGSRKRVFGLLEKQIARVEEEQSAKIPSGASQLLPLN